MVTRTLPIGVTSRTAVGRSETVVLPEKQMSKITNRINFVLDSIISKAHDKTNLCFKWINTVIETSIVLSCP